MYKKFDINCYKRYSDNFIYRKIKKSILDNNYNLIYLQNNKLKKIPKFNTYILVNIHLQNNKLEILNNNYDYNEFISLFIYGNKFKYKYKYNFSKLIRLKKNICLIINQINFDKNQLIFFK